MAELLSTRAIVLRTSPYGESDLIVSLLTEQFGKRSAFAARARTANKKLRGGLRPLSLAVVHLKPRLGSDLDRLMESEVEHDASILGKDLRVFGVASVAAEAASWMLADHQGDASLFERTERLFIWLVAAERPDALLWVGLCRYLLLLLDDAGVWPGVEGMGSDESGRLDDEVVAGLSPRGWVERSQMGREPSAIPVSEQMVEFFAVLEQARMPSGRALETAARCAALLHAMVTWQTQRPLQSWDFLCQVMSGRN